MNDLYKKVILAVYNKQIVNIDIETLNKFFKALNDLLKGSNDSLIKIEPSDSSNYILTNLWSDYMEIRHINKFVLDLRDYLMAFSDNKELMYDIMELLNEYGLFDLTSDIRLLLFNRLYNSGYFCYVAINSSDFIDNYDSISRDLSIISDIVSNGSILDIDTDITVILKELYAYDYDITLKDILI